MTFIRKKQSKRTCKDFKPSFWDRDRCKLTGICSDTDQHILDTFGFCTGVEYSKLDLDKPPRSGSGVGYGVKPTTKRPKPKPRPKIKIGLTD